MKIAAGQAAPSWEAEDIHGNTIRLEDYRGKKMMLSFYRYASCPLCNLRVHELIVNDDELVQDGLYMVAVFQSPKDSILRYVGKQNVPFPIIADPGHRLYKQYGVEPSLLGFLRGGLNVAALAKATLKGFLPGRMEGDKTMVPADFLINKNGVVDKAYYGKDISDHMPLSDIKSWLV